MDNDFGRITLVRLHAALAQLNRASSPSDWPDAEDGLSGRAEAALLARLRAAETAIEFAAALLARDDPPAAGELEQIVASLATTIRTWRRSGRGWFEERMITRPRQGGKGTGEGQGQQRDSKRYGPYYYFRWRDGTGKLRTQYLSKERPPELDRQAPEPVTVIDQEL